MQIHSVLLPLRFVTRVILAVSLAQPVLRILQQPAVRGQEVGQKGHEHGLETDAQEDGGEDQRLDHAGTLAGQIIVEKSQANQQTKAERDQSDGGEEPERLVDHENADNGHDAALDVRGDALDQPGGAEVLVYSDRDRGDGHVLLASLNDGFQGVGVGIEHVQAHGRVPGHGSKSTGRVRNVRVAGHAHHPGTKLLKQLLQGRKVLNGLNGPCPDHQVGLLVQNRFDQGRDVLGIVLVVRVRVHDHIRPPFQTGVQPSHEGLGQSLVLGVGNDMINAVLAGDGSGVVRGAVIDDQPFHRVKAWNLAWQVSQGNGQGGGFVVAGDLDDEFHLLLEIV